MRRWHPQQVKEGHCRWAIPPRIWGILGGSQGFCGGFWGSYHEVLHVPDLLVDVVEDLAAALGRLLHLGPLSCNF